MIVGSLVPPAALKASFYIFRKAVPLSKVNVFGGNMAKIYGYARVSTKDQDLDRQIIVLKDSGVPEENIFYEKETGSNFDRPVYKKMLVLLEEGDTLIIKSFDRFGRNYKEIHKQWNLIVDDMNVNVLVLDMPELFLKNSPSNTLMQRLLADNMLNFSAYLAEMERTNTLQRQREGIEAARKRGVHLGRCKNPLPENFEEKYTNWKGRIISAREAARRCEMNANTFLARARERNT